MRDNNKEENANAFKHLFGKDMLGRVATSLSKAYPDFDKKAFTALLPQLLPLEMKPRVLVIRDAMRRLLPSDYAKALKIILRSAKDGTLKAFDLWPYTEFVQTFGIDTPDLSLEGLKVLTTAFTSEWAVRPFIKKYPAKTMKFLETCAKDKDVHVRRWASEGTRPRLPWGERLHEFVKDPKPTAKILDALKFDEELYVRKSVSNHLNDIAKDHPDYVVKTLAAWSKAGSAKHTAKINWITHRSLRTLIKDGHPGALALIGVTKTDKVSVKNLKLSHAKLKVGERLNFSFDVASTSAKPQKIVVDYIVHFVKANQKVARKVFKLKTLELPAKGKVTIEKSHHFKKITTRDYYAGEHTLAIQINGQVFASKSWHLHV